MSEHQLTMTSDGGVDDLPRTLRRERLEARIVAARQLCNRTRFNSRADRTTGFTTRAILCVPLTARTGIAGERRKNEFAEDNATFSAVLLHARGPVTYTLETAYNRMTTGADSGGVMMVRPGLVWVIPRKFTFGSRGRWLLGGAVQFTHGPDGSDVRFSAKVRGNFDFLRLIGGRREPAGTPPAVLNRVQASVVKAMATPEVRKSFDDLALGIIGNTPTEFAAQIRCITRACCEASGSSRTDCAGEGLETARQAATSIVFQLRADPLQRFGNGTGFFTHTDQFQIVARIKARCQQRRHQVFPLANHANRLWNRGNKRTISRRLQTRFQTRFNRHP